MLKLDNKVKFILGVVNGEIIVNNRKRAELFLELQQKGFTPFPKKIKTIEAVVAGASEDSEETEDNSENAGSREVKASDYEYLLSMAIGTLTREKVQELCAERDKMLVEVEGLKSSTAKDLWLKDLEALEHELDVCNSQSLQSSFAALLTLLSNAVCSSASGTRQK